MLNACRSLTFLVLTATLTLTGCGWESNIASEKLRVDPSMADLDIRGQLLALAPMGSHATNVLRFVVDDLHPKWGADAYFAYVDALQAGRSNRLNVGREDERPPTIGEPPPGWTPRYIYLVIGKHPKGRFIEAMTAKWTFDKDDNLVDLVVGRNHSP